MSKLESEAKFFHHIAEAVIKLVQSTGKNLAIAENKGAGDYSTKIDVDVENLIAVELAKSYPSDQILAEEGHSDTAITGSRIWLIDPICGTMNLGKGIGNYCTNIALVDDGQVIAACVIDHSRQQYFWSIGDDKVYLNDQVAHAPAAEFGRKIDVDFGSVRNTELDVRLKHNRFVAKIIEDTSYDIVSLNTSLAFAYTALGRTDGFVNVFNHPWDIAAAAFLVRQAGGVVTGLDGSPWTVTTVGAIGGRTPEIHKELLDIFLGS